VKNEEAAAVSKEIGTEIGSEDAVLGTGAGLVGDLAPGLASAFGSDLPADFVFKFNRLRLGLELAPRAGAVAPLELDLELTLA